MLTLYYSPGSCSFVVHALLEHVGAQYEIKKVLLSEKQQKKPSFLKINPAGQIPVLTDSQEKKSLSQTVAIVSWIADAYPEVPIFPTTSWERAQAYSKLLYFNTIMHPTFMRIYRPERFVETEVAQQELAQKAKTAYTEQLQSIENSLVNNTKKLPYTILTAVDLHALICLRWASNIGIKIEKYPNYYQYAQNVADIPSVSLTMKKEGITL